MKKLLSVFLAIAMVLAVAIPAMAAATATPANRGLVTDGVVDFDDLLDTLEPSDPEETDINVTGTPTVVDYTVSGSTVTVDYTKACKVGYLDGDSYVMIAATSNPDGTYSFAAPDGVTEVLAVVKGDANNDGEVNIADKLLVARSLLPTTHAAYQALTTEQSFGLNVDNSGVVNMADKLLIARSLLVVTHAAYQALTW